MSFTGGRIIAAYESSYRGRRILDYHNDHRAIARDEVVDQLIPSKINQCALGRKGAICMRPETVLKVASGMRISAKDANIEELMAKLTKVTGCDGEKCVLEHARKQKVLSESEATVERKIAFKQSGPTDVSLLNDGVICDQLYAWMYAFSNFWAYNFNMIDFATSSFRRGVVKREPDTLATVDWCEILAGKVPYPADCSPEEPMSTLIAAKSGKVRCGACIINSDVYDGPGKHWMALFVDARDESEHPHWTVEFFNSAAIPPEPEWVEWQVKTRDELLRYNRQAHVDVVNVCKVWHQHTKTECGVYSLFYIWARLNNTPARYFMENVLPDQIIFEFRQHLFNTRDVGQTFDYGKYVAQVNPKWESEGPPR